MTDENIIIKINPKIYSLDVIKAAAHILTTEAEIHLNGDPESEIEVTISPKNKEDNKELREKFNEQLLNYSVYKSHSEKTKDIRNAIIQRVLLTNDSEFIDAVIEELRAQDKK
ncbi:His-Xaa-Ser system protein HxsD [Candidatus Woesearchaeota archaeon]|nr:His-Xaa-Ser system protein HxsD [Candidatus Woesearchaeota archaeon]MBT3537250.1 His-Xaa-Ser system protein HxsD [Candidatus Woesearchaeota archaeon]MBT4698389.1 His-Xaa-Ser system protein HxsD [Candidatus Woesearchaeota archaeon]MBT7106440.1 His-Xaa-Ser system protein HxsD [Candidatus Woesearchaeota archaeon]MBT7931185.1 His-Xaa-Ser system protein HxsD [Candidatus Woesearchaeota archaeon]